MEDIKKTAKTYGTVSEKKILEEAKNIEETTEKMIEDEIIEEDIVAPIEVLEEIKVKPRAFKRESFVKTREEIVSAWSPKTKLGQEVKDEKVKSLDEILENNQKILEPEIVDKLIDVKTDLLSIGQSKGKFGGGKRRAWRQTQRITQEGGVMTFSAMAVVGDGNGHIGIGVGKSNETLPARDKATKQAKLNVKRITRGCAAFDCSCSEPHTVPFEVIGKQGSVVVKLIPAPQGTGLVVANELKKILSLAGIKDVYSKTFGRQRTTFNFAKACIKALEETNRK
jgi:small subunit ribosomal protein S5